MQPDSDSSYPDQVRAYCNMQFLDPARRRGDYSITIRAGDVHSALIYKNQFPLVCAALGTSVFEESNKLVRISIDGPLNSANTLFTYLFREKIAHG